MKKKTITKSQLVTIDHSGEYVFSITKPGVELTVEGVFQTKQAQRVEIKLIIHHQAPNTMAETTLKGVARDKSRISFAGKIVIDRDCGNSRSFLTERILLLSPQAKAEAIPDLEILTDDVSCSHAASVSSIPDNQLFYLMSRGVSRRQAEELIVDGFLYQK